MMAIPAGQALAVGLTAQVDRQVVPVGETFNLSLVFDDVNPGGAPNLPNLPNLEQTGVRESKSFSFVNGATESKLIYTYSLVPTKAGDITIPAMQVNTGGKVLTTQPIQIKIVQGTPPPSPEATLSNLAWLKLSVPKTEVYMGEAFPVEIALYVQSAQDVQMPQLKAEGFSIGQSVKPQQTRTQVGNAVYNLIIFRMSATAARTGDLKLGAESSLTLQVPDNSRRPDPFGDPFGGFFNRNYTLKPVVLQAETQVMHVLPLPTENVPASFNGTVGTFSMRVTAGPTNLAVGDPITVKAIINGNGPIEALRLPEQPAWRDFKTYAPTSKTDVNDPLGLTGTKTFEQVVIPQNHEIKTLPPLEFSFFDPNRRAYQTLRGPEVALSVRPTVSVTPPPTLTNAAPQNSGPGNDDIVHIKPQLAAGSASGLPLLRQGWFLALQGVPILGWLALFVARKRRENLANNPRLRRQRAVAQRVREGLAQLQSEASAQKSDEFFATLFRLLQEQLGERLDLPSSAITEAIIEERLASRELPPETIKELRELFLMCNQARYAPQKSVKELHSIIPRVEKVVDDLRKMRS
jgi:hypothetical protein